MAEQNGACCEILDAYNRVQLLRSNQYYRIEQKTQFGSYISLLPFTDRVEGITLTGFQYPLTTLYYKALVPVLLQSAHL